VSSVTTCNKNYNCVYETLLWLLQPKVVDPLLQGTVVGLPALRHSRITLKVTTQELSVAAVGVRCIYRKNVKLLRCLCEPGGFVCRFMNYCSGGQFNILVFFYYCSKRT
jgi:hypothetical protein